MKATQLLHNLGQSIWLDNITRELLNTGTLKQYVADLSVTGLTSNPTIFDHAIKNSTAYDSAIREKLKQGKSGEALFFELAWVFPFWRVDYFVESLACGMPRKAASIGEGTFQLMNKRDHFVESVGGRGGFC
jgi:Transaldolase/Fructose-6-phosphate aldolase